MQSQSTLDALADAETLRMIARDQYTTRGWRQTALYATQAYGSGAANLALGRYETAAAKQAAVAASAAFLAVPGLRG